MCMYGGILVIIYFSSRNTIVWTVLGECPQTASDTVKEKKKHINWEKGGFPLKESKIQNKARA